jgi:small subunit ribosomal protein S17
MMSEEQHTSEESGQMPEQATEQAEQSEATNAEAGQTAEASPTATASVAQATAPEAEAEPTGPRPMSEIAAEATAPKTRDELGRNRRGRKELVGLVVSDKPNKTITVSVERQVKHHIYSKFIKKTSKFAVHDENNDAGKGDLVQIMSTRPLSKNKRWRLTKIIERAK